MIGLVHSVQPDYSIVGFAVGVLMGMTGVGGGSLTTPLLILLFGIHPATAVGTDLLYAAATKIVGSVTATPPCGHSYCGSNQALGRTGSILAFSNAYHRSALHRMIQTGQVQHHTGQSSLIFQRAAVPI